MQLAAGVELLDVMKPAKFREFTVIVLHIALWAQVGVLTRIYLNKFFADGCTGGWGVCLTSDGALHTHVCRCDRQA